MSDDQDDPIAAIRRRPGMYIGDVHDGSGLAHLVLELLANSVDEFLAGRCTTISVEIGADDSLTVEDDGRGIPVHDVDGEPFAQRVLTRMHHRPTFDGHAPHEHIDSFGAGLCPLNAVSSWLELESRRDGRRHTQRFEQGRAQTPLRDAGPCDTHGTRVTYLRDPSIFEEPSVDVERIATRMRELAATLPGLRLHLRDLRERTFHAPEGLLWFARHRHARRLGAAFELDQRCEDVRVEVALTFLALERGALESFANVHRTSSEGSHVEGLLNGLAAGLRDVLGAEVSRTKARKLLRDRAEGAVCVRLRDAAYEAPTRSRLATPRVSRIVRALVRPAFATHLRRDDELRDWLAEALLPRPQTI